MSGGQGSRAAERRHSLPVLLHPLPLRAAACHHGTRKQPHVRLHCTAQAHLWHRRPAAPRQPQYQTRHHFERAMEAAARGVRATAAARETAGTPAAAAATAAMQAVESVPFPPVRGGAWAALGRGRGTCEQLTSLTRSVTPSCRRTLSYSCCLRQASQCEGWRQMIDAALAFFATPPLRL